MSSFTENYRFPGNRLVALLLDALQRRVIRRSVPVAAGPVLASQFCYRSPCHVFLSTTHNQVLRREPSFPPRHLLYVGTLETRKRVIDLLDALLLILRLRRDVLLTIVGDGRERQRLQEFASRPILRERVTFTGYISDPSALRRVYLHSDILVLPSTSEGTPKVLAEAMAHGVVPVAVRGVGSNDYVIEDGVNGFLVGKHSPHQIARIAMELGSNEVLYRSVVQEAYAYASRHTLHKEAKAMWSHVCAEISKKPTSLTVETHSAIRCKNISRP